MDAVVEAPCEIELFRRNQIIYLHCIDLATKFQLAVSGFPILRLNCVYGHASFLADLAERRIVVFPDGEALSQFRQVRSPCCINVKSSAIFDVLPEEAQDGDGTEIAVIWKFDIEAGMSASASGVCPVEKPADGLTIMPRLDLKKTVCNCTRFPHVANVLLEAPSDAMSSVSDMIGNLRLYTNSDIDFESEDDRDSESDSEPEYREVRSDVECDGQPVQLQASVEVELCTEVVRMKGSSFHDHFQRHLKRCKELLVQNDPPDVRFWFETTNKRDENAIVLQAKLKKCASNQWLPIGYVPGPKVPKLTLAIRHHDLRMVKLNNVFYQYIHAIQQFRYFPSVAVTKSGKWPKNKANYQYNDTIE